MINTRPRQRQSLGWAAAALILGVCVGFLPLYWSAALLLCAVLILLYIADPLWAFGLALLLGPTKPLTDVASPQLPLDLGQMAFIIALGVWLLHRFYKRTVYIPHTPFTWLLGGFIFISMLSLVDTYSLTAGLEEIIKWVQMLILVWVITLELSERPQSRWLLIGILLAAATVQAVIGVWQFALRGTGPEYFAILGDQFYRAYGTFEQPNPFGGYMAMTTAFILGLCLGSFNGWRKEYIARLISLGLVLGLCATALIMSWSRGSWLGFATAAVAVLALWPRKIWVGGSLLAGSILSGAAALYFNLLPASLEARLTSFMADFTTLDVRGLYVTDANFSVLERVAHWQAAWYMARSKPLFGIGIGNYEFAYADFALLNWPEPLGHAHNFYLNTLGELGFVGICYYLGMWALIFWMTWRVIRSSQSWSRAIALGLFGVWVHLSAHSFLDKLYVANMHLYVGVLLGLLAVLWMEMNGERITA